MIVVKIELQSAIDGSVSELGRMYISNDGTGNQDISSYNAKIMKKYCLRQDEQVLRIGRVRNYKRKKYPVWILIKEAIESCYIGVKCK